MSQMNMLGTVDVPEHRIKHLAGFLAGWRWPGAAATFERLPKKKQQAAYEAAQLALMRLAEEK